jgi:hypothetical protein
MNGTASLLVAKDIQQRAHADARRDRRLAEAASAVPPTAGHRWVIRLHPGQPWRRRSVSRVNG